MIRKIAIFAAALAALAFMCQGADAHGRKYRKDKDTLTAVSIGVGAASFVTYLSLNSWKLGSENGTNGLTTGGAWLGTTIACAAVSPMVATVVLNRPLKYREAHILVGSCVVPIVGGWLVNEAYKAGWVTAPDEKRRWRRHKKG
jgi:hypothetical protein